MSVFISTPQVSAADATWDGFETLSYDNETFTLYPARGGDTQAFFKSNPPCGPTISFRVAEDPGDANSASYFEESGSSEADCVATGGITTIVVRGDRPADGGGAGGDGSGTSGEGAVDTCKVDGIGWIVCPVAKFLGTITDQAYIQVEKLLVFKVADDPLDGENTIFVIWSSVRNVANVAFIMAFFVVIFSQATSIGLSSYGIRKMLPRIVAAALLVNLSYYLCVFAVDLSNIIGAGIGGIIETPLAVIPASNDGGWEELLSGALVVGLVGAAAAAAAFTGVLALALPLVVLALTAIVVAIVVLIARQALIIILIILSPLAFVAFILPNTDGYFKTWRKSFMTMLILYPAVAVLFSGSKVASSILQATSDSGIMQLFALAVLAIPLFGVPYLVKFSGGIIGRVAGAVNNPNKGLVDRTRNKAKTMSQNSDYQRGKRVRDQAKVESKNKQFGSRLEKGFDDDAGFRKRRTLRRAGGMRAGAKDTARSASAGVLQDDGAAFDKYAEAIKSDVENDKFLGDSAGIAGGAGTAYLQNRQAQSNALLRASKGAVSEATNKEVQNEKIRIQESNRNYNSSPENLQAYAETPEAQNQVTMRAIGELMATNHGSKGLAHVADLLKDPTFMRNAGEGAEGFTDAARQNVQAMVAKHPDVGQNLNDFEFTSKSQSAGGNTDVTGFDWNTRIAGDSGKILKLKGSSEQITGIKNASAFTTDVAIDVKQSSEYADATPPIKQMVNDKLKSAGIDPLTMTRTSGGGSTPPPSSPPPSSPGGGGGNGGGGSGPKPSPPPSSGTKQQQQARQAANPQPQRQQQPQQQQQQQASPASSSRPTETDLRNNESVEFQRRQSSASPAPSSREYGPNDVAQYLREQNNIPPRQ